MFGFGKRVKSPARVTAELADTAIFLKAGKVEEAAHSLVTALDHYNIAMREKGSDPAYGKLLNDILAFSYALAIRDPNSRSQEIRDKALIAASWPGLEKDQTTRMYLDLLMKQ